MGLRAAERERPCQSRRRERTSGSERRGAFFVIQRGLGRCLFFALHILVLDGVEDLAARLALDELCIFVAGDDTDDGVFAGGSHRVGSRDGPVALDSAVPPVPCQCRKWGNLDEFTESSPDPGLLRGVGSAVAPRKGTLYTGDTVPRD